MCWKSSNYSVGTVAKFFSSRFFCPIPNLSMTSSKPFLSLSTCLSRSPATITTFDWAIPNNSSDNFSLKTYLSSSDLLWFGAYAERNWRILFQHITFTFVIRSFFLITSMILSTQYSLTITLHFSFPFLHSTKTWSFLFRSQSYMCQNPYSAPPE